MKLPPGLVLRGDVWYIDRRIDGRRFKRSLGLRKDQVKEALAVFWQLEREFARGNLGLKAKKDPTLKQLFDNYLKFKRNNVTERTFEQIYYWLKHLLKETGAVKASQLTPAVLMEYLNNRAQRHSNTARKTQFQVIAAFDYAVSLGMLEQNPFKSMARIKHEYKSKEPLSEREFIEFWRGMTQYSCRYLVAFLIKLGCRFG